VTNERKTITKKGKKIPKAIGIQPPTRKIEDKIAGPRRVHENGKKILILRKPQNFYTRLPKEGLLVSDNEKRGTS